eukprot:14535380-Alexandrium_andersonii.AAC.1
MDDVQDRACPCLLGAAKVVGAAAGHVAVGIARGCPSRFLPVALLLLLFPAMPLPSLLSVMGAWT